MRLFGTFIRLVAAVTAAIVFSSCGNREAGRIMDSAEDVMWTMPDSALAALESIDTLTLKTKAQRARHSLLYTMALDRNQIDTSDIRVVRPAARYYERHGSREDKMKMYYYLGTVQQNAGDLESAISSYIRAKEFSSGSENMVFRGLISSAVADVYSRGNNYIESLKYANDALALFSEAEDSLMMWRTTGKIISLYVDMRDYERADSLFAVFFSLPCRDSSLYARQLMNEALSCLWRPIPEPDRSEELFLKADKFSGDPTPTDYCAYAYSLELQGNSRAADGIISQLVSQGCPLDVLDVWMYRICRHRGEYKKALYYLEQSVTEREDEVFATVNQSVVLARSDYYENKSLLLDKDRRLQRQMKWLVYLAGLIVVASVLGVYLKRRMEWLCQVEEMSRINENVNRLLSEETVTNEDYRRRLEAMEKKQTGLVDRETAIRSLRSRYIKAYRSRLDKLVVLCAEYWESFGKSSDMERVYRTVGRVVSEFEEGGLGKLEEMVDEGLDGIMSKLKSDIPGLTEKERRFIIFQILGFDAKTMSRVIGYSVDSVYTKRNRLKKKIQSIESENRDLYAEVLFG